MDKELLFILVSLLTGGFLVYLAITISRDSFENRINRIAGAMLFFAGLGPVFLALGFIIQQPSASPSPFPDSPMYQIHTVWELFFPTLLLFTMLFPVDRAREFRQSRLRTLIFVPQVMHLVIVLFFGNINRLLEMVEIDPRSEGFSTIVLKPFSYLFTGVFLLIGFIRSYEAVIFDVVNLLYVGVAIYFIETSARYLREPRLVSQTRSVVWGARIGLGLYLASLVMLHLFARQVPAKYVAAAQLAAVVTGAAIFGWAIIRHRFLDIQLVFRQSFIYTIIMALVVGGYVVLGMQAKEMLTPLFGERAEMVSYVFLVFVLLLFQPISSWLDNLIRSMFIRTRTDYRAIIERFSRQVISVFEPRQLRQTIEETLKTALLVEQVYFVLYDDSVGEYTLLPDELTSHRTIVERDDLMLRGINLLDAPTHYTLLSEYAEGSTLADRLNERKVKLILPMKDAQHLLGFLALTQKAAGYRYSAEDFNLLGVLSNQMVTALTNARLYVESLERLRLQEEVNMARQIQLDLLPSQPPQLPCSVICASSIPSRTVGGDFYDFVPTRDGKRLGIVIADASGKGMPAALMMAQIQAMIRSEVSNGTPIPTMMGNLNQQVVHATSAEKYVTLFYGELDTCTGRFDFANAGHNYPVLVRANGSIELLEVGGPIIGAFGFVQYTSSSVQLHAEDLLFFFTDGLSEAMNAQGQEYGEERIRRFVAGCRGEAPETIMQRILDDVRAHDPSSPPQDDTTIIAMKMADRVGATA